MTGSDVNMRKCDFCTQSTPGGKCPWKSISYREAYCRSALDRMVAIYGNKETNDGRKGRKKK